MTGLDVPTGPEGPHVDPGRAVDPKAAEIRAEKNPLRRLGKVLGPGLITGASDDDPSGIGTYAQAGAQHGFATLWMVPAMLPMVTAVQYIGRRAGEDGDGEHAGADEADGQQDGGRVAGQRTQDLGGIGGRGDGSERGVRLAIGA